MHAMERNAPLTASDFYRFFQCPHWPYWERFGDPADRRPLNVEEEARLADGLAHERDIVARQYGAAEFVDIKDRETGAARTLELMREGVPVIYQGWLADEDWVGRPDILERRPGTSLLGEWFYVPVDVKRAHELKKEHMCQLAFYATLLERAQGHFPTHPAIINGDGERLIFDASAFRPEFQTVVEQLERIRTGEMPPPVYRKSCNDTSPWGKACLRLAESRRDIALLFNVDVKKLKALRSLGVLTIDDAAILDIDKLEGKFPGLTRHALESVRRQAESLVTDSVIIREAFVDPTQGLEIHFDIESYPPEDRDYLFGFWMNGEYKAFVADSPQDEKKMWKEFLAWMKTLPEAYTVFHYANYEITRIDVLARRYGDENDQSLARFRNAMCDLKELARKHVVFPLHFYSLKAIAKFLGFTWKGDVKGGGESVLAYERWLASGDRSILESIIQYNREDVQATAHLLDWLRARAQSPQRYYRPFPWTKSNV